MTNTVLSGSGSALTFGGNQVILNTQTGQFASTINLITTGSIIESKLAIISGTTGAFITTSQTGQFYPASNPNGYITSAQAGGVSSLRVTGLDVSGVVTITGLGGIVVSIQGTTLNISGGSSVNTGGFVTTGQTGAFITSGQLVGLNTGSFITTSQTGQFVAVGSTGGLASVANLNTTGAFLQSEIAIISGTTGAFITNSQTGQFIWTGSQQSFVSYVSTGIDASGVLFPVAFATTPKIHATIEVSGDIMYMVNVRGRGTTGYTAIFSDTIQELGVYLHTFATL